MSSKCQKNPRKVQNRNNSEFVDQKSVHIIIFFLPEHQTFYTTIGLTVILFCTSAWRPVQCHSRSIKSNKKKYPKFIHLASNKLFVGTIN